MSKLHKQFISIRLFNQILASQDSKIQGEKRKVSFSYPIPRNKPKLNLSDLKEQLNKNVKEPRQVPELHKRSSDSNGAGHQRGGKLSNSPPKARPDKGEKSHGDGTPVGGLGRTVGGP